MKEEASPLGSWQQGDFALNVGGFSFGVRPDEDDLAVDEAQKIALRETEDQIVGVVVVSQTCEVVRMRHEDEVVAVCPLVQRDETEQRAIAKGRRPSLAIVENSPPGSFADLSRIMSISKDLLSSWERKSGFCDSRKRLRFAAALERKFGRFAFPDDFNLSMSGFQKRVWSKHDKASDIGKVYRSIRQIRFRVSPDWNASNRKIAIIAILEDEDVVEIDRKTIGQELADQIANIALPEGYDWAEPKFILLRLSELSAEDLLESQQADFDFLST